MRVIKNLKPIWIFILSTPLFVFSLIAFRYSSKLQFETLSLAVLTYLTAALLHHLKEKTLNSEVVIEYVLLAALALIIFQSLLL